MANDDEDGFEVCGAGVEKDCGEVDAPPLIGGGDMRRSSLEASVGCPIICFSIGSS
jgi:hypothetical protein